MRNRIVETEWKEFAARVLPDDAPEVQRIEMRRAFYAGVWALLCKFREIGGDDVPEDVGVAILESVKRECEGFVALMNIGRT